MLITATVQLGEGETFPHTADEAANLVFSALGGDDTKDHCSFSLMPFPVSGTAGTLPNYNPPG
jgi:hypothetical protein